MEGVLSMWLDRIMGTLLAVVALCLFGIFSLLLCCIGASIGKEGGGQFAVFLFIATACAAAGLGVCIAASIIRAAWER